MGNFGSFVSSSPPSYQSPWPCLKVNITPHYHFSCLMEFCDANLSFAGCGFLCIYHAGVCAALKEYAPQLIRNKIYGASAGAIAAAGLLSNVCVSEATSAILQVVCEARAGTLQALSPTFDLMALVRDGLERILPADAHLKCSGRLHVSLTRYRDCENVMVSEFATKKDLIQAIVCSCYIPVFCGFKIPEYQGEQYIDGGFSDNQPVQKVGNGKTITVSPFSGESDICPIDHNSASLLGFVYYNSSIRFTNENFYRFCSCFAPPSQDICSRICRQGFADALRFLTKNSITPCARCLTIQSCDDLPLMVAPPSNKASLMSPAMRRRRLDSECELCLERIDTRAIDVDNTKSLFPKIMQKTLEETQAAENRYLSYLLSFRIVKWSLSTLSPVMTPFNYGVYALKLVKCWLDSPTNSKKDHFMKRLHVVVDFLLREIEERSLLYSPKFNCQASSVMGKRHGGRSVEEGWWSDEDSIGRVVEHADNHDAAMVAYHHYGDGEGHEGRKHSHMKGPIVSTVFEEEEGDGEEDGHLVSSAPATMVRKPVAEVPPQVGIVAKKRDACCSPVRHFGYTGPIVHGSGGRKGGSGGMDRRHTIEIPIGGSYAPVNKRVPSSTFWTSKIPVSTTTSGGSPAGSTSSLGGGGGGRGGGKGRSNKGVAATATSSDSDADAGDDLFVVANRRKTNERGYDGEPEPSDG